MSSISAFWIVAWFLILRHQKIFREIILGKESLKSPTLTPTLTPTFTPTRTQTHKKKISQQNSTPNHTSPIHISISNNMQIPDLYLPPPMINSVHTDDGQFHRITPDLTSSKTPKVGPVILETLKNAQNNLYKTSDQTSPLRVIPDWFNRGKNDRRILPF
jgi:hypothetical protein